MLLSSIYSLLVFFSPPKAIEKDKILFFQADVTTNTFKLINTDTIEDISALHFVPNKNVKIICHGMGDNITSFWYEPIRKAYLENGEENLIFVDWGSRSSSALNAIKSVQGVGEIVANLIINIAKAHEIPFENFHLIGHSLGAHISGIAGNNIYAATNTKIGRITGLDPAGPTFRGASATRRLTKEDAIFVDVIHTDIVIFGNGQTSGHADFYTFTRFIKQNGCKLLSNCSHLRAPWYFIETITDNTAFKAIRCNFYFFHIMFYCKDVSIVEYMGEALDHNAVGTFYFTTKDTYPYGNNY